MNDKMKKSKWCDKKRNEIDTIVLSAGSYKEAKGKHEGVQYLLQHREYGPFKMKEKKEQYFLKRLSEKDPVWLALYVGRPSKYIGWMGLVYKIEKRKDDGRGPFWVKVKYITSFPTPIRRGKDPMKYITVEYASMGTLLEVETTEDVPLPCEYH